jgi:hypothetical protein
MSKIYIIHENDTWTAPLLHELESLGLPYESWFLDRGLIDIDRIPPAGVFYNRMSASSHTRDHRFAPEYTAGVLSWLEGYGRRVLNSSRALQLEVSKIAQYTALNAHGIRTPKTVAAIGSLEIVTAARKFSGSFITKHNRAGKGLGVRLFDDVDTVQDYVHSAEFLAPIDGITLVQEYIESPQPYITRVEFVGGKFLYAVRVDTSGGFELCPADVCSTIGETVFKFSIIENFHDPIIARYEQFLAANDIHIAGIEFIVDKHGQLFTYDVNTNTNYNSEAERSAGLSGMQAVAKYLGGEFTYTIDTDFRSLRNTG